MNPLPLDELMPIDPMALSPPPSSLTSSHLSLSSSYSSAESLSPPSTPPVPEEPLERPFYFTFAHLYEDFSPLDLDGVSCTLEEYFFLCDFRYELVEGILVLREMPNQPSARHDESRGAIVAMANGDMNRIEDSDGYIATSECTTHPGHSHKSCRVLDCAIYKTANSEDTGPFTCDENTPIHTAIEIVSPHSRKRDYEEKKREQEKRGTEEYILVDHRDQKVLLFKRHERTRRFRKTEFKGDDKLESSKFFKYRTASEMLSRSQYDALRSPSKRADAEKEELRKEKDAEKEELRKEKDAEKEELRKEKDTEIRKMKRVARLGDKIKHHSKIQARLTDKIEKLQEKIARERRVREADTMKEEMESLKEQRKVSEHKQGEAQQELDELRPPVKYISSPSASPSASPRLRRARRRRFDEV